MKHVVSLIILLNLTTFEKPGPELHVHVSRPINIHGSKPNYMYHIPPLTKFLPFKKITTNTYSPCKDLIDLTNAWSKMATAPNVNERKYRNKKTYMEEGKCVYI